MATKHGYCSLHRIAFNRDFDPICPQCSIAHIEPFKDLDYDVQLQKPLDAGGRAVEPAAVVPTRF